MASEPCSGRDKPPQSGAKSQGPPVPAKRPRREGVPKEPGPSRNLPGTRKKAAKSAPSPSEIEILPVPAQETEKIEKMRRTASLWKFHPVPDGPDPTAPSRAESFQGDGVSILAASVRGKKHIHSGSHCDDWFAIDSLPEKGMFFIAVSDGAGSRPFSRVGAKISCESAVKSLRENFRWLCQEDPACEAALRRPNENNAMSDEQILPQLRNIIVRAMLDAYETVYDAFEKRIGEPGYETLHDFRDLSATLLLAALILTDEGGPVVIGCRVGDGDVALLDSRAPYDGSLLLMGQPDSGSYAGETEFLTSASMRNPQVLADRVKFFRRPFDLLLMMTDGVADDYFPSDPNMRRLYYDLLANGILSGAAFDPPSCVRPDSVSQGVPAPLRFPGIHPAEGGKTPDVPLNYAWLIESARRASPEELWNDRTPLRQAFCLLKREEDGNHAQGRCADGKGDRGADAEDIETRTERLRRWLEHYVASGSFDDRTLVIVQLREGRGGAINAR